MMAQKNRYAGRHSGRSRHEFLREVFDVHALKGNGLQAYV